MQHDSTIMFEKLFAQSGLSLERMKAFAEIVEAGGITAASGDDSNRQSQLSRQLKELERYFGAELLKRGQQRFTINCSPCHGQLADGNGITRKIGAMAVVANLHDKRIVEMTDGELFYVISNGRNLMRP